MTEQPSPAEVLKVELERRRAYFDELKHASGKHRERAFEYEKLAVDYSKAALQAMAYLNGGALLAIPTALTVFSTNINGTKATVLSCGSCFILGLISVGLAYGCAFFTMAKRSEGEIQFEYHQLIATKILFGMLPNPPLEQPIDDIWRIGTEKSRTSNRWRLAGLIFFWISILLFLFGASLSAFIIIG